MNDLILSTVGAFMPLIAFLAVVALSGINLFKGTPLFLLAVAGSVAVRILVGQDIGFALLAASIPGVIALVLVFVAAGLLGTSVSSGNYLTLMGFIGLMPWDYGFLFGLTIVVLASAVVVTYTLIKRKLALKAVGKGMMTPRLAKSEIRDQKDYETFVQLSSAQHAFPVMVLMVVVMVALLFI